MIRHIDKELGTARYLLGEMTLDIGELRAAMALFQQALAMPRFLSGRFAIGEPRDTLHIEASFPRETIDVVFHGTTIATNAILEHDGAVTGMITTGGYRDILHIGRHQRPQHYSIMQDIPWQDRPLVKRRFRKTVKERLVPPRGEELEPLDEAGVRQAWARLRGRLIVLIVRRRRP